MRILVIDDEPDVLLLCRVNLEFEGHEILEASDGEQGFDIALQQHPDLIVLDVMLPQRDGFQVLQRLSDEPATREIPVVMLTAKAQEDDQMRGWLAGASGYVVKPFSPVALTDAVRSVLSMTPEQRAARRAEQLTQLSILHRL
jgi:DNA-binding response OmpR family regulator